jgi:hypothetical protein
MKVRIVRNPKRFPEHLVVMTFSRFEPAMNERVPFDTVTYWVRMLWRAAETLTTPLGTIVLAPLGIAARRADCELYGLPSEPDLEAMRRIVEESLAPLCLEDVEVRVAN